MAKEGVYFYSQEDTGTGPTNSYLPKNELVKLTNNLNQLNESIPLVDDHPEEGVTTKNAKRVVVGSVNNFRMNGPKMLGTVTVYEEETLNKIRNGKKEVSTGYEAKSLDTKGSWNSQDYDTVQLDLKLNHLALVDEARFGRDVRLAASKKKRPYPKDNLEKNDRGGMVILNEKMEPKKKMKDPEGMSNEDDEKEKPMSMNAMDYKKMMNRMDDMEKKFNSVMEMFKKDKDSKKNEYDKEMKENKAAMDDEDKSHGKGDEKYHNSTSISDVRKIIEQERLETQLFLNAKQTITGNADYSGDKFTEAKAIIIQNGMSEEYVDTLNNGEVLACFNTLAVAKRKENEKNQEFKFANSANMLNHQEGAFDNSVGASNIEDALESVYSAIGV